MMPESRKELVGVVAVESGHLLIIDPSHLMSYNPGQLYQKVCDAAGGEKRCGQVSKAEIGPSKLALAFNSGYGDGSYGVYAKWDATGKIIGVEIDFGQVFLNE